MRFRLVWLTWLLLLGCWNPFHPPSVEGPAYPSPTQPEQVIQNLQTAYIAKDLEAYLSCLDPDSFKFYFDSQEDSIAEILREYWGLDSLVWGYSQERIATEELFDAVNSIQLTLFSRGLQYDSTGTRATALYDYILSLDPSPPDIDLVEGRALFVLRKRPSDGLWYIVLWQDYALEE